MLSTRPAGRFAYFGSCDGGLREGQGALLPEAWEADVELVPDLGGPVSISDRPRWITWGGRNRDTGMACSTLRGYWPSLTDDPRLRCFRSWPAASIAEPTYESLSMPVSRHFLEGKVHVHSRCDAAYHVDAGGYQAYVSRCSDENFMAG